MSFLTPIFLALAVLAGPIILLYMLRLRRREVLVSSTMLWQKLLRDREANAPWQRLKRNLLLLLQLLILAALVLSLARPFIPIPAITSGNVVVLLDASASMQATDVTPNRYEAAKAEARELIGEMGGDSQMTLINVGRKPSVIASATTDRASLRQALADAQPDASPADWPAAFALAAGAAQGYRNARIVLISDGGLPEGLPPLPSETIFLPVGNSGENLAIAALATRQTEAGPQLFASVANHGRLDRRALFSLTLDGTLFDSRQITVPAGQTKNMSWDLPEGTAVIQGRLTENEGDLLALDDTAWAVHAGGVSNRALLVTAGNVFLEQAFSLLPGVDLFKIRPGGDLPQENEQPFDLVVFDSAQMPTAVPAADMLIINPQPGEPASGEDPLISVTGSFSNTVAVRLADSPLLQFVDWRNVHIRLAQQVTAPWAMPLVTAEGGPLLLVGERGGRRIAVLTFDLHDSDLPLQIAFPVLMANITGWLNPGRAFDAPSGLQPGMAVSLTPGVSVTSVSIVKPDGVQWTAEVGEENLVFTETDLLGVYRVTLRDNDGDRPGGSFAVNLFDAAEANIRPAATVRIGRTTVTSAAEEDIGQRELWPWLLAIAIAILLVEWWIYHRGAQLPGIGVR